MSPHVGVELHYPDLAPQVRLFDAGIDDISPCSILNHRKDLPEVTAKKGWNAANGFLETGDVLQGPVYNFKCRFVRHGRLVYDDGSCITDDLSHGRVASDAAGGLVHPVRVKGHLEGAVKSSSALQECGSNTARGCCQHDFALGPDLAEDEVRLSGAARSIEKHDVIAVVILLKHFEETVVDLALVVGETIL